MITEYDIAVKAIERAVNKSSNPVLKILIEKFARAIYLNYLNEKGTNTTYWYDQFKNPEVFNKVLYHLTKSGWIISEVEPKKNWAEIKMNQTHIDKLYSREDIRELRINYKVSKYQLPDSNEVTKDCNITKTPIGLRNVGLTRPGSKKQSSNTFRYDVSTMVKYYEVIHSNLTKSMRLLPTESTKEVSYDEVATEILNMIIKDDSKYKIGNAYIDSRGRLIKDLLSKVFNPISNKDARSLLVVEPKRLGFRGKRRVYLAIAELLGYKPSTVAEKAELGKIAYENKTYLELDLEDKSATIKAEMEAKGYSKIEVIEAVNQEINRVESERAEVHCNIWLERLYTNLDVYEPELENWNTPIELDQTASMLQIEGVLLNHKLFLEMTNVIGDTLQDAWSFNEEGITRNQFKKAMTPRLYGSSQACQTLWSNAKINWNMQQVKAFNKEISVGAMAVADKFKDFIINNVKPESEMTVRINGEVFKIYPNKYKSIGDYTVKYTIFDSRTESIVTVYHTATKKVADLDRFRTYFVTLLVHNLDSQLADFIELHTDWCLAIYDAFIVHPADAHQVESAYCIFMKELHNNRELILKEFFDSVGITTKSKEWRDLCNVIVNLEDEFIPQASALK